MQHLAIYYIATSNYKMGFEHFKKNLKYLFPNMKKTVIVLSDGLDEWNNIIEDGITYKVFHIEHFCWPIVTLFKMKHILDHKIDCDYVCYMNGTLVYNNDYTGDVIDLTKLNLTRHAASDETKLYDSDLFEGYGSGINKKSKAYIVKQPYTYVQGCFFLGPADITYKMCDDVSKMVEADLLNNLIPSFHDESYLNKWRLDNPDLIVSPIKKLVSHNNAYTNIPFVYISNLILKDRYTKTRLF